MKVLLLVRHAKSSWKHALPDRDRPLAARGRRDAPKMAKRLARRRAYPDLIVSSPAARARSTARRMARKLGYRRKDIVLDARLYPTSARRLLEVIRALDDGHRRVMLVGHNPGLLHFVHGLAPAIQRLPTAAVAQLEFEAASWSEVGKAAPVRARIDYPRVYSAPQ